MSTPEPNREVQPGIEDVESGLRPDLALVPPAVPSDQIPHISGEDQVLPSGPLTRDEIARQYGLSWSEVVRGIKRLQLEATADQEKSNVAYFNRDAVTGVTTCSPEAVKRLLVNCAETPSPPEPTSRPSITPHNPEITPPIERGETTRPKIEKPSQTFEQFGQEMKKGETLSAQNFKYLVDMFGAENAVDILCRFREEFNGKVPMDKVHSFLKDYLGEFTINNGELDFDKLGEVKPYLVNVKMREALSGVIKRDCLRAYNKVKRANPDEDAWSVVAEYLDKLYVTIKESGSKELATVVSDVTDYYLEVFDLKPPTRMVNSIAKGRPYPDINQRINIYETMREKRFLVGDDPGMGKSDSAIMAKEMIGSKCAVVVVPSAVLELNQWQEYLSSEVGENGEQIGHFKPGQEPPKVLEVKEYADLENVQPGDYEYILISHEKINAKYCERLKAVGFDMLIVDESHKFKKMVGGKRAEHLIGLADTIDGPDKHLMLLTATPATNKVGDIAMSLRLLYPDRFKKFKYADLITTIVRGDLLDIRSLILKRMQFKRLKDSIEIEPYEEEIVDVDLSDYEKEVQELITEDWELDPTAKIRHLRKANMNPACLEGIPEMFASKIAAVGERLRELFKTKKKIGMFINGYVDDIMTGDMDILDGLNLPSDVRVEMIYGDVESSERRDIRRDFQGNDEKMFLMLSGGTASVGADLSAAEVIIEFNEPWTQTEIKQQIGRGWRPGRSGKMMVITFITRGTIEEGIHDYIAVKNRHIEKLINGLPLSEVEQKLVLASEKSEEKGLEVNSSLGQYYFSSIQRLRRLNVIFSRVKEKGEEKIKSFLRTHGKEYAETYQSLTTRSFQANSSRLCATLISRLNRERAAINVHSPFRIFDLGSGPEMLRIHVPDELADTVTSFDINPEHFGNAKGKCVEASITNIPESDKSADFVNLSLVLHYNAWRPAFGEIERLKVLAEVNRVLKTDGFAVISMIHSQNIIEAEFRSTVVKLGFMVVDKYSGIVKDGDHFNTRAMVLQKVHDCPSDTAELLKVVGREARNGLHFPPRKMSLRDGRRIAQSYTLESGESIRADFSSQDQLVLDEEQATLKEMEWLRDQTATKRISDIPPKEITARPGFARIFYEDKYLLYKRLVHGDGSVVFRDSDRA